MMLSDASLIASAGLRAQGERLNTVAQNVANADSTGRSSGEAPYRRKLVVFGTVLDRQLGVPTVKVVQRTQDMSEFNKKYEPSHPAADAHGYVLYPNVNMALEMTDMREARRGYEANLSVVQITNSLERRTLSIIS